MAKDLREAGCEVVVTFEPGGTVLGNKIRMLTKEITEEPICTDAELLLMFASRVQHVEQVIKPAISRGAVVLCDRFSDSTYAYQGSGRGLPWGRISELEKLILGSFKPDLTLLLDLDVADGMTRAEERGKLDRFEVLGEEFFQKVREGFRTRATVDPDRITVIDAGGSIEDVHAQIKPLMDLAAWRAQGKPGTPTLENFLYINGKEVKIPKNLATFNSFTWGELSVTDKQKMHAMLLNGSDVQKREVMAMITKG
jgi:dTMP kinase